MAEAATLNSMKLASRPVHKKAQEQIEEGGAKSDGLSATMGEKTASKNLDSQLKLALTLGSGPCWSSLRLGMVVKH